MGVYVLLCGSQGADITTPTYEGYLESKDKKVQKIFVKHFYSLVAL
jgi:hypothetical protein